MVGLSRELRLLEEGARTATGYKSMRGSAWPQPNDRNRRPCSAQPVLSSVVPARPVSAIGLAALCGAPWRQPRNPPRDVGPKILVLGPKLLSKHRLLVREDKGVEGEPHEPAVRHETPVAEQDRLAQNDGDYGNVYGIAHVAIQTRHHKVLRRCDRRRRAEPLQGKARKRVNKPG